MAIITLTSDWGNNGYYAAAVKGVILSKMPDAVIVDVCHNVNPFNHVETAFLVKNAYPSFPEGTIHIIAVDSVENEQQQHLVVKFDGQYFIASDNGVFSIIVGSGNYEAVVMDKVEQDTNFYTFSARDRFAKVAVMLAQGAKMEDIGGVYKQQLNGSGIFQPRATSDYIEGHVVFIDSYGNAITNITKEFFLENVKGRRCEVLFGSYVADIKECYDDVQPDELVAFFGTHGFLEIAINRGFLSRLCGVTVHSIVQIAFEKEEAQLF